MKFNVKRRDGPARTGELVVNDKKSFTPNIFFVNTKRFKSPASADILISDETCKTSEPSLKISDYFVYSKDLSKELHLSTVKLNKKEKKDYYILPCSLDAIDESLKDNSSSVFIVSNAFQLFFQPKRFVEFIATLRQKIGYQKMIYLPVVGEPSNYSLLSYLGIDLFDSSSAIVAARNKTLFFSTGNLNTCEIEELPCSCPSCNSFEGESQEMDFETILNHNYHMMLNEIKHVRNVIRNGCLRNLVESRVKTNPVLTTILRNLDMNHAKFLENRTPVTGRNIVLAMSKESLCRPEIKRFQQRVINRYKKPELTKVLLLLPCSAKKPYSFSKSHRIFRDQLFTSGNPFIFHEVIITSPLGIVPRELELVYPASNYDIPVTGIWNEDEKKMIKELLTGFLNVNNYDKIIAHLPKEITDFTKDLLKKSTITCVDHPTSEKSIESLSKTLKDIASKYDKIKPQARLQEDFESLASYQFDKKIARNLMKSCTVRGKYPYHKIMFNNTQLGMVTKDRGFISLTKQGAEKLVKTKEYYAEIYDDFKLVGSVFAPGIKNTDENIRIGDEVIILQNGKLKGVGVAMMNGEEMTQSTHGEAVKIRHVV